MKRSQWLVLLIVCFVLLPLSGTGGAQVQPFDLKKGRQELEIMRGILRTTLGFASKELAATYSEAKRDNQKAFTVLWKGGDFSSIGAFYLAGQGAVFTIPASGLRDALRVRKEFNIKNAFNLTPGAFEFSFDEQAIEDLTQEHLEEIMNDGLATPPVPPVPPPASVAVAPSQASPAPAAPPQAGVAQNDASPNPSEKQEQMRRKLSELQAKEKRKAVEEEARRAKFREVLTQLKGFLIEALANHGDSMTVVKPNEYLNLVITDDGRSFWVGGDSTNDRAQREIISVQKSVISDYKAGRLTLDGFKQKVMNYMN